MVRSVDPRTGAEFGPEFPEADAAVVERVVARAARAGEALAEAGPSAIMQGLGAVADSLDADIDALVTLADAETALGIGRLTGEVARTSGQLRSFVTLLQTNEQLGVITSLLPAGAPARELRRMNIPIGVVAVFAASNFPFAFSVAGGDTASALAAGCAVVVKAHYGHPQTSARVAQLLARSLAGVGLPEDSVQLIHGETAAGAALVTHPDIAAVGFTGSTHGGRALSDAAGRRPVPIPVYAEQGSLNPVVIGPSALVDVAREARLLAGSVSVGAGQFCTKPGLIFIPMAVSHQFVKHLAEALADVAPLHLLTEKIHAQFSRTVAAAAAVPGVEVWSADSTPGGFGAAPVVLNTDVATFIKHPTLREELFGPATVVIGVRDEDDLTGALSTVGGNLTGTVHGDLTDSWVTTAVESLQRRVGRLVFAGVPTGVAVDPAMHHGGPYPASSSPLYTSVGTAAIYRFLRPIVYQDFPADLLPAPLRAGFTPI